MENYILRILLSLFLIYIILNVVETYYYRKAKKYNKKIKIHRGGDYSGIFILDMFIGIIYSFDIIKNISHYKEIIRMGHERKSKKINPNTPK